MYVHSMGLSVSPFQIWKNKKIKKILVYRLSWRCNEVGNGPGRPKGWGGGNIRYNDLLFELFKGTKGPPYKLKTLGEPHQICTLGPAPGKTF